MKRLYGYFAHLFDFILIITAYLVTVSLSFAVCAYAATPQGESKSSVILEEIAHSNRQWTGVAVAKDGRIFVNYPYWSETPPTHSVAVLSDRGEAIPYPNQEWNSWNAGKSPKEHFICVQSVYVDKKGYLWILDPANPRFQGVVSGGPKLLRIDPEFNGIAQSIYFDETIAPKDSYLNDVRVDTERGYAYITDSGLGGDSCGGSCHREGSKSTD